MKKIALVGTCPSGKEAPYDDESWEIWGVGTRAPYVTRATRWFEIHQLDNEAPDFQVNWRKEFKEWFKDGTEIWMFHPEPDLGNVIQFPAKEIATKYGTYFLTSTFAWMFALAIEEGATDISLFGVDMEYDTEYREQRNGVRHFIELSRQLKINVSRLFTSGVAYEPVPYPMFCNDPLIQKLKWRKSISDANYNVYTESLEATQINIKLNEVRIDEAKESKKKKYAREDRIVTCEKNIEGWKKDVIELRQHISNLDVLKAEQDWFLDYLIP